VSTTTNDALNWNPPNASASWPGTAEATVYVKKRPKMQFFLKKVLDRFSASGYFVITSVIFPRERDLTEREEQI